MLSSLLRYQLTSTANKIHQSAILLTPELANLTAIAAVLCVFEVKRSLRRTAVKIDR
jgi:hypothetical protein